jgi:hypothetical protein
VNPRKVRSVVGSLVATALLASFIVLGTTSSSSAAALRADKRCSDGGAGYEVSRQRFDQLNPVLPAMIPRSSATCYFWTAPEGFLAYLDNPLPTFLSTVRSFVTAGWSGTEKKPNGERIALVLSGIQGRLVNRLTTVGFQASSGEYVELQYSDFTGSSDSGGLPSPNLVIVIERLTDETGSGAPSDLSDLRTIAMALLSPVQAAVLFLSAAVLTLLVGVPSALVSAVVSARYDQWFGWVRRRRKKERPHSAAGRHPRNRTRWAIVAASVAIAAVISGFIDPAFGLNAMSGRVVITQLLSFALFNVGGWLVIRAVLRRVQPSARPTLTVKPITLAVVLVTVVLSRILDFDPGIVFGLVSGLAFAVTLALSREALVVLVGSAWAIAIALLAWIAYSVLPQAAGGDGSAITVGLAEFCAGLTIQGASTLPFALVPLARLDGATLFRWNRRIWMVSYGVGAAFFMIVLLTIPGQTPAISGDFVRWISIFAAFAVLATGL